MDHIEYVLEKLREAKRKEEEGAIKLCPKCGGDASLPGFTKDGRTVCPKCGYCGATEEFLSPREPSQPLKERWKGENIEAEVGEEMLEEEEVVEPLSPEALKALQERLAETHIPYEEKDGSLKIPCPRCGGWCYTTLDSKDIKVQCKECDWKRVFSMQRVLVFPFYWWGAKYITAAEEGRLDGIVYPFERWENILTDEAELYIPAVIKKATKCILEETDTYPPFAEITAILILGALYAPYFEFSYLHKRRGRKETWNLGAILVGRSGVLHKSSIGDATGEILQLLTPSHIHFLKWGGGSPEGMEKYIIDTSEQNEITSFFLRVDELNDLFTKDKDYRAGNMNLLLKITEGRPSSRLTLRGLREGEKLEFDADKTRFTFLATTTMQGLEESMNVIQAANKGFLGRVILYVPPEEEFRRLTDDRVFKYASGAPFSSKMTERRDEIIDDLAADLFDRQATLEDWRKRTEGEKIQIQLSEESTLLFGNFYAFLTAITPEDSDLGGWISRIHYHALKIGALIALEETIEKAVKEQSPLTTNEIFIEPAHLYFPIRLALRYWIPSLLNVVRQGGSSSYQNPWTQLQTTILNKLHKKEGKMMLSELEYELKHVANKSDIEFALSELEKRKLITIKQVENPKGRGRKAKMIFLQ